MRSYLLVALAVLGSYSATTIAATEQIRHPYQVAVQSTCNFGCLLIFPATTARTIISRVSCQFALYDGGVIQSAQISLLQSEVGAPSVNIQPFAYPSLPGYGSTVWATNNEVNFFVDKGQILDVNINVNSLATNANPIPELSCSLFGYTMD